MGDCLTCRYGDTCDGPCLGYAPDESAEDDWSCGHDDESEVVK